MSTKARLIANLASGNAFSNAISSYLTANVVAGDFPALGGDLTNTEGNTTVSLVTSGVSAGSYGNTTAIPVITVDAKGRITAATTNSVSGVTGLTYTNANTTVTVSTSTVDYSANLEPGLNQAYSNAVSTASADATTKAGTAYSNAVSTASADATSKAATAYSNATSYADTKAAAAYTNAVAYAASNATLYATFVQQVGSSPVTISNTLSVGNTTVTGFANVTGSLQVGGTTTIGGNLVVNGSTVTVNTSQVNVTDSIMYLASNNEVSDSLDIGFAGHYNNGAGANGHTGFIRSAITKKYYLFQNYQPEFFANNNVDVSNTATGIQMADLVVGNLVANSTLTVTGAAAFSNTLSVTGLITGTITSANNADYLDGQHGSYYANSTAPGTAYSNAIAYAASNTYVNNTFAPLAGATFSGAVSGITTLAAGNTTISGTAKITGNTSQHYSSFYVYNDVDATDFKAIRIGRGGSWSLQQGKYADITFTNSAGGFSSDMGSIGLTYDGYGRIDFHNFYNGGYNANNVVMSVRGNNTVGINNTAPSHTLSVNGTGYFGSSVNVATTFAAGNTTITGTASISSTLTAGGSINANGNIGIYNSSPYIDFYQAGVQEWRVGQLTATSGTFTIQATGATNADKITITTGGQFTVANSSTTSLFVGANGSVGIGTSTPTTKLLATIDASVVATTADVPARALNWYSQTGGSELYLSSQGYTFAANSTSTTQSGTIGVSLYNTNQSNAVYAPALAFGSYASGGYVNQPAAITAQFINSTSDSNWKSGELVFLTSDTDGSSKGLVERIRITKSGNLLPGADATYNLGSTTKRWNNIYTADAHFSNEGTEGNSVDGTTGNWTLQEGEDNIYMLNNKTGKRYKIKLEEV